MSNNDNPLRCTNVRNQNNRKNTNARTYTHALTTPHVHIIPPKRLTQTQNKNKWRKNVLKCDIEMNDNQIIMFSHNAMVLGL